MLTHSSWAREILEEEIPDLRVRDLPMGVPLAPPADPVEGAAFRRRHGLPLEAPLIGAFGFQTPMKRTEVLIDALQDPALAGVHLMVAGEVSPIYGLANYARLVGVEERVHFLGYLPSRSGKPASPRSIFASICATRRPARPARRCCASWRSARWRSSPTMPKAPTCPTRW